MSSYQYLYADYCRHLYCCYYNVSAAVPSVRLWTHPRKKERCGFIVNESISVSWKGAWFLSKFSLLSGIHFKLRVVGHKRVDERFLVNKWQQNWKHVDRGNL